MKPRKPPPSPETTGRAFMAAAFAYADELELKIAKGDWSPPEPGSVELRFLRSCASFRRAIQRSAHATPRKRGRR